MTPIDTTGARYLEVTYEPCASWEEAEQSQYPRYYWDTFERLPPDAFAPSEGGVELLEVQYGATIALCAAIAAFRGDLVRVLDVGGWYGEHYLQVSRLLRGQPLRWTVVDTPVCVEHARAAAPGAPIEFESDWQRLANRRFDVVHFGGVLHCVRDWQTLIADSLEFHPRFVILSRTHFGESGRVFRQRIVLDRGTFTLPVRTIPVLELTSALRDLELVARWQPAGENHPELGMRVGGMLFERSRARLA
jgi:putative methyltransferase (TIGR04325 family)